MKVSAGLQMVERSTVGDFEQLLTPQSVALRLAVSRSMVYTLIRRGNLPVVYIGRLPRVAEADLAAYLDAARRGMVQAP